MIQRYTHLLLLLCIAVSSFGIEEREYFGVAAEQLFPAAEHIWVKDVNTIPAFAKFQAGREMAVEDFFFIVKKQFHLPSGFITNLIGSERDELGWQHDRYQVLYNGVAVKDAIYILHSKNGKVLKYNGTIFNAMSLNTSPTLAENLALQKALKDINATTYKWQIVAEENNLKQETGNTAATYFPKGELFIVQKEAEEGTNNFHLAYRFDVYAQEPMSRFYVYVDAQSGAILRKENRIHTADVPATGVTVLRGNRAIVTDSYNGSYRLREAGRGNGILTLNMQKGTNYNNAVDFTNATTTWNNVNANKDQYATDAHWGGEMTYDFYKNTFNRNSIDNVGFQLKLYMHYSTNYGNAFWDGDQMTFGDGDGATFTKPLVALDVTGHEITHGLTEKTAALAYQNESGALNESFSDVFGTAVEWYGDSTKGNWLIGEDLGSAIRSMSNPKTYNDPDCYQGTNWYTGTGDNGGVHTNSGVQNYWYYLLSTGKIGTNDKGNAYNVVGIGRAKATAIAFRNLTVYLTSSSKYTDARFYAIQAATDLYGSCSQEVSSTANAWYAVGVGAVYTAKVTAQFSASNTVGCNVPFTVNFTNQSANGNTYTWYFGDGTTSTATNPSHTYTTLGTYSVKLVAMGGSCGNDSITKTNLISLSVSNPCSVVLPPSGSAQTQVSCTGVIYDDGGQNGTYSNYVNSTVTIAPTNASKVTLTFTKFRLEAGYDFLYVYDGPSTASPLLGAYTGLTLPASVSSTVSSITVKFVSDPAAVDSGFAINWQCTLANAAPVANFISSTSNTCTGKVRFQDRSTGGPTSWLWNFGDGTTSTLQSPFHNYISNGTYNVTLTATNSFGSNAKTINGIVTVAKPAGPAVVNASRCGSGSLSLSATTTNDVTWYDSLNAQTAITTINPYIIPPLSVTKDYYAEESVKQPIYKVGATSNAIGAGSNFNGNTQRSLRFRVYKESKLVSVYVYATGSGYRTVEYRDTLGQVLANRNVFVPNGGSRITLNIDLVPSSTVVYELGVQDSMNMYRNTAGAVYPYNDGGGMVSIIGNNIPGGTTTGQAGYYYYFYDWEVQAPDCISQRTKATAKINTTLTATASKVDVNCFGGATGTATASVLTGTPTYTYNWSNGQSSATATNLAAGNYSVTVSDLNGCSAIQTVTVSQPSIAVNGTVTKTDVTCFGGSTGTATAAGSGGTSGYSYLWSNTQSGANATGLLATNYSVTITDSKNCTVAKSVTIGQPTAVDGAVTKTDVACFGGSTGTATVAGSGGTSGYSYLWSNTQSGANATGLLATNYSVTITDSKNCTVAKSVTIGQPSTAVNGTVTKTDVACFGGSTGTATAAGSGGTSGYSYLWSNTQGGANATGLSATNYSVTITDSKNCTVAKSVTIGQPSTAVNGTVTKTDVACFGGSNGTATAAGSGGTSGYSYLWSNTQSGANATGLSATNYSVTITDSKNCTVAKSVTIGQPSQLAIVTSSVNASCGVANGKTIAKASGGSPGYSYVWTGGQLSDTAKNLNAGSYTVTVADSKGCKVTQSASVNNAASFSLSKSKTDLNCFGDSSGLAAVSAVGSSGYSYKWNTGQNTASLSKLNAGTYIVTVTDVNSCVKLDTVVVQQPIILDASFTKTDVVCFGGSTGTATVAGSGGTSGYSYLWSNTQSGANAAGLSATNYSVTITDSKNCTVAKSVTIGQPASAVDGTITKTDVACFGENTGTATAAGSGGTSGYSYLWSNTQSGANATGLLATNYSITITDSKNCTVAKSVTIVQPASAVDGTVTKTDVACFGGSTGTATVAGSGGTSGYSYLWSNTQSGANATGLSATNYSVTITDSKNCTVAKSVTIGQPASALSATATGTAANQSLSNGTATATPAGGTAPYSYLWNDGQQLNPATGLTSGSYTVTITDKNGCQTTASATVSEISGIANLNAVIQLSVFPNPTSGKVSIQATLAEDLDAVQIFVRDVLGRTLTMQEFPKVKELKTEIDLSNYADAVYLLEIKTAKGSVVKEIILSK